QASGQVNATLIRTPFDDRGDQDVAAPQVFVAARCRGRVIRMVQPQRSHDGKTGEMRFSHGAVEIGHQAISQFQILAAYRLDCGIVALTRIRIGGASGVIGDLVRSDLAGVPSPRQPQLPGAAVGAKQWTESAELKPADVQLARELLCRDKASDVGSPEWNPGQ